jgi:hypothetical protein
LTEAAWGFLPPQATGAADGLAEGDPDGVTAGVGVREAAGCFPGFFNRATPAKLSPPAATTRATTIVKIRWRRLRRRSAARRAASFAKWRSRVFLLPEGMSNR